ncbi:MAG: hypothetical protein AAGA37_19995 [Actinomycetota bacterium]
MTRRRQPTLVLRAQLIGAYRRRDDLTSRRVPTGDVEARIAELETQATDELINEARRLAEPSQAPAG